MYSTLILSCILRLFNSFHSKGPISSFVLDYSQTSNTHYGPVTDHLIPILSLVNLCIFTRTIIPETYLFLSLTFNNPSTNSISPLTEMCLLEPKYSHYLNILYTDLVTLQ